MKTFIGMHLGLLLVVGAAVPWLQAMAATPATMEFESQALDLDTGTVSDTTGVDVIEPTGADVKFGYHADRVPHCVVVPAAEGITMAFLDAVSFAAVTAADVAGLSFFAEPLDVPLNPNDTVVVRTDTGAIYKLGNAYEFDGTLTINYEGIQQGQS